MTLLSLFEQHLVTRVLDGLDEMRQLVDGGIGQPFQEGQGTEMIAYGVGHGAETTECPCRTLPGGSETGRPASHGASGALASSISGPETVVTASHAVSTVPDSPMPLSRREFLGA